MYGETEVVSKLFVTAATVAETSAGHGRGQGRRRCVALKKKQEEHPRMKFFSEQW